MWHIIKNCNDLSEFMNEMCHFHDSCIKEMHYISGAYVGNDLSMYPINSQRVLRVVVQRQFDKNSMIEMEFIGLKHLKLSPVDENYTCEILESTMIVKDGNIYWCDCGCLSEMDLAAYEGTFICASQLRWRAIENHMGDKEFYHSEV